MKRLSRMRRRRLLIWLAIASCAGACDNPVAFTDNAEQRAQLERLAQAGGQPGEQTPQAAPSDKIEPRADELVRKMSDYMGNLPAFRVRADHIVEVYTDEGQKLQLGASSTVTVKRPNKLRSDRKGEIADLSLYYDGNQMTIYGRKVNLYATAKAPATLDAAIDFGRESLELEAPGADLLYSNPYKILMENAKSGRYIGTTWIRGRLCHHLAFRNQETDWQLWVADGDKAFPCKYVVTSKRMEHEPQFSVVLYDWDTNPQISEDQFVLQPAKGAERIEFFKRTNGAEGKPSPASPSSPPRQ